MRSLFPRIFAIVKITSRFLFSKELISSFFFLTYSLKAADEITASIGLEYAQDLSERSPEAAIFLGLDGYSDNVGFIQLNQDKIDLNFHKKWVDRLNKELNLLNAPELNSYESFCDFPIKHHLHWVELSNLKNKCAAQITFLEQAAGHGLLMVPNPYFQGLIDDLDPVTFVLSQFLMAQKRGLRNAKERLALYLNGDNENKPFIIGVQSYLTQKIKTLQANDSPLIYPSAPRIYTIISRIKSFRKYSPRLLNDPITSPLTLKFWHQTTAYIKFLQSILPFAPEHTNNIPPLLYEAYIRLHGVEGNLHDLRFQAYEEYIQADKQVVKLVYEYAAHHCFEEGSIALILNHMRQQHRGNDPKYIADILKQTKQSIRTIIKTHQPFPHFPRRLKFIKTTFEDDLIIPGSRCLPPKMFTDTPYLPEIMLDEDCQDYDNPISAFSFTAHVAWPGHALQFHHIPTGALLRTPLVFNLSTAEGWASYAPHSLLPFCETLKQKVSLWIARQQLAMQAALHLDLMIGNGSNETFKDHLMADFKMDETEATAFMESHYEQLFSLHGIELVACYQGQRKITDFREILQEKMGSRFKLKRFHKAILKSGLISFDLSFPLINRYFNMK